ncbi:uncharacterized protein [Clytia hemisphaerica]|uniref:Uncharacterized protein n=1 Tax=Clytia hemisphaerica TaxID=252671 RepID=A0A7M5WIP0_9CNID
MAKINICNTKYAILASWIPKDDQCNLEDLTNFIEDSLQIPSQYQVLYNSEGTVLKHTAQIRNIARGDYDTELVLAYKYFPTWVKGTLSSKVIGAIQNCNLEELRSVSVIYKYKGFNKTLIENLLDELKKPECWMEELRQIFFEKYGLSYRWYKLRHTRYKRLDLNEERTSVLLEQLFLSSLYYVQFKEDVILELSLEDKEKMDMYSLFHCRLSGLKKIVLKSLTKVMELDVKVCQSFPRLKKSIEEEWLIPAHLQLYLHHGKEILEEKSFLDVFIEGATEAEQDGGKLELNLISKTPQNLTVILVLPEYMQDVGIPTEISMPETSSIVDVEKKLTEEISLPISLYSSPQPCDELLKKPERILLYQLKPLNEESIVMYAYRTIHLAIYSCKKCNSEKAPLVETSFAIRGQLTVKDVVHTFIKNQNAEEYLYCCNNTKESHYKLSDMNSKSIKLNTNLIDIPGDSVLSFQLEPLKKCVLM